MRRAALLIGLAVLGGCGQGGDLRRAAAEETSEIAACRTTYPPHTGHFSALVECEQASVFSFVQQTDTTELHRLKPVSDDIARAADEVEAGHLTVEQWRAQVKAKIDGLPSDDRRIRQGLLGLL